MKLDPQHQISLKFIKDTRNKWTYPTFGAKTNNTLSKSKV
jgi:hypothetical protein